MEQRKCHLCSSEDIRLIHKGTRDNSHIDVLKCANCELVFLSSFDHIREGYYEESGMHVDKELDIVKWRKSTYEDDIRRKEFLKNIINKKDVLDFGCGNGGFIEYAQPLVNSICGIELEEAARKYLLSDGKTIWADIEYCDKKFDVITLFHVLEHLEHPIEYLMKLGNLLKPESESQIIIEIPNADDALLTLYHSTNFADFTYWSPHLFLYNPSNIETLVENSGFRVNWIKQVQRYPLANHLYWLSKGMPGGHAIWNFLNDNQLHEQYERILSERGMCDTILVSLSK
ncbi:methyltransferase [Anaerocolumna cellulosilytica]|uniref:Methyltransferase n=1 Tax=Anaerocolumna cellulosilytica TaxID=433286 RepID=A0A6S6QYJ1_9FIRM|nr:class I SAM-dependent methyltransferase [Anaerocolumna cellulosilytica]MBB5195717.1 2-polyprenyl-3-methyl-5-hydroxy-6-metoxy-1,4-benzoquinol methylase [Anaerocolumna cellulosilytica]BCJ92947.1 methyltransferase [Anaerocolumna cellulosilytica]